MVRRVSLVLALLCSAAQPVHAAKLGLASDAGMGGLGGAAAATVQTGLELYDGGFALDLFGRARFVLDEAGRSEVVRRRDWDEPSDFVHILRDLSYRRAFSTRGLGELRLLARAGEILSYSLGHGTLVREYTSVADPDHPRSGIELSLESERLSVAAMLDNPLAPSVIAGRIAARPFSSLPGLGLGVSLVVDPRAPLAVVLEGRERQIDGAYNLRVDHVPLTLLGIDLEHVLGREGEMRLVPYLDLNTSMHGLGLHLGASGSAPLGGRVALTGQLEWRVGSAGYAPAHVETFYDVERFQASLAFEDAQAAAAEDRGTKLAALVRGAYGGHGVLGQAGLVVAKRLELEAGASFRPGPDALTLFGRASSTPHPRVQVGVFLSGRGVGGPYGGAQGLMALAEGRVRITSVLYGLAQYGRTWALSEETRFFDVLQWFNLSLGAAWSG